MARFQVATAALFQNVEGSATESRRRRPTSVGRLHRGTPAAGTAPISGAQRPVGKRGTKLARRVLPMGAAALRV